MWHFPSSSFRCLTILVLSIAGSCFADESTPQYAEHYDLSYFLDSGGSRTVIRTPDDWHERRKHIILGMEAVMGPLPRPAQPVPLDVEVIAEEKGEGFVRRKVAYHTDRPDKRVRA
jgi:hypothetical protein